MNNKNLNCHPERVEGSQLNCCFRSQPPEAKPNQVEPGDPEGSQPLHISSRDITENAKLNHEIAEELRKYKRRHPDVEQSETEGSSQNKKALFHWILRQVPGSHIRLRSARSEDDVPASKHRFDKFFPTLRMTSLMGTLFLLPTLALAEQCTPTPDCKSLGYTESSCPDGGGVKCPWNTSLMYCCKKCEDKDPCLSCFVGSILNSDMTCSQTKINGKTPIGVVANQTITTAGAAIKCQGVAAALSDLSGTMNWSNANSQSNSYSASGITGWHLPTRDELLAVYSNMSAVSSGLTAAGGFQFTSNVYWSSSPGSGYYWVVSTYTGGSYGFTTDDSNYVRPMLAFEN